MVSVPALVSHISTTPAAWRAQLCQRPGCERTMPLPLHGALGTQGGGQGGRQSRLRTFDAEWKRGVSCSDAFVARTVDSFEVASLVENVRVVVPAAVDAG
eukprot:scaffold1018_cov420-Prasinococcus_capsulatus_cf.AAC.18